MYILEPTQYELTYYTSYSGTVKIDIDISDSTINVICAKLSEDLDFYYVLYIHLFSTNNVYEFYNIAIGSLNSVETIDRKEKLKNLLN